MQPDRADPSVAGHALVQSIKDWGRELGFAELRIADLDLSNAEAGLKAWLAAGMHGEMDYMASHGTKRARPAELAPGSVRAIVARMDYLPADAVPDWREREIARQHQPQEAVVSMYARGRDYHKVLRSRLQKLADRIAAEIGPFGYRVFTDSAPVMEVALAERSGLGWRGKHTLLLHRSAGSMFFLGEILIDLPLPVDAPESSHCGQCTACLDACPTQAIIGPYQLDARRCISYLTLELKGSMPEELRPLVGNRIAGCDDCQLACPWNKFAGRATLPDFDTRPDFSDVALVDLFAWSEAEFLHRTEGSALRRIGYTRWLRNVAVGLGNALRSAPDSNADAGSDSDSDSDSVSVSEADPDLARAAIVAALEARRDDASPLVREHVAWALNQRFMVQAQSSPAPQTSPAD